MEHKTMLSLMNRAVGRGVARGAGGHPLAEGSHASGIRLWAALQMTSHMFPSGQAKVLADGHHCPPSHWPSAKTSSLMPTPPQSQQHFAGSAVLVSRRSRASA